MIIQLVVVLLVVMGAYALVTTGHYTNRTPRERFYILGVFFVLVLILILDYLGLLHSIWDYASKKL